MSHPQYYPPADAAAHAAYIPRKAPVHGVGLAAGIVSIACSLWMFVLALGITALVVSYGMTVAAFPATAFWLLGVAAIVLGIMQIALNRRRKPWLPLSLLAVGGLTLAMIIISAIQELHEGVFVVVSIALMLPLVVLALLAFISARKGLPQEQQLQPTLAQ